MNRGVVATVVLCLAAQATGAGAGPAPVSAEAKVDPYFSAYTPTTPGCAVGVEQSGRTLFEKGYGSADLETRRPLTPQSKVYMASVSKQVTAMALLLLVRDGRLNLSDPVRKFIPELPPYAERVTVAQLLNHTSGLRDYFVLGELSGYGQDHVYTEDDVLGLLGRQHGLNFEPGAEFLYSNSGYVLASIIIKRVSGQRLDDFARVRLFAPIGMTGSRFQHDHTQPIPDKANGYAPKAGGWTPDNSYLDVVGDGGLYSDVDDMLRWLANLDRGAVGKAAVATMRASARLNDGASSGYGMGLSTTAYRGLELVEHGGALAGYRTADWWFPKQKLGVVVLCNSSEARPDELAGKVAAVFLAGQMAPPPGPAPASAGEDAHPFAGLYRDATGGYGEFAVRDGGLVALRPTRALVSLGGGQFVLASDPAGTRFVFDAAEGELRLVREGQPTRRLQRTAPVTLSDEAAAAYAGDFVSTEVSSPIHIRRAKPLELALGDGPAAPLIATGPDRLWDPTTGAEVVFARNAEGKVTGLTLSVGRARGLRYEVR